MLPASIMGIGTDLGHVMVGFVLPFWIVVGSFAAAFLVNILINPVLYAYDVLHTWEPGMSAIPTQIANSFDFWLSFSIGGAVLVAVMGFAMVGKTLWTLRGVKREGDDKGLPEGRGDIPIPLALGIWAISTLGFVALVWYLVPEFPWWISAFFGFVWTPIYSYIGARMIGLTGSPQGASFPYLREGSFYLSGYQGAAVWFAPIPLFQWGYEAAAFKQLELTRTHFGSIVQTGRRYFANHVRLLVYILVFHLETRADSLVGLSLRAEVLALPRHHAGVLGQVNTCRGWQRTDQIHHSLGIRAHGCAGQRGNFGRAIPLALASRPILRLHRRRGRVAALSAAQLHRCLAGPLSLAEALRRGALASVRADSLGGLFVRHGISRHVFHRAGADF